MQKMNSLSNPNQNSQPIRPFENLMWRTLCKCCLDKWCLKNIWKNEANLEENKWGQICKKLEVMCWVVFFSTLSKKEYIPFAWCCSFKAFKIDKWAFNLNTVETTNSNQFMNFKLNNNWNPISFSSIYKSSIFLL